MLPGLGQFRLGEGLEGAGFLAGHLGIVAGSLAGAYFLLPADLRFDRRDYLGTPMSDLRAAWTSHGISDLLPAIGVLAAGGVADMGLRFWSASAAHAEAKTALDSGRITPEPLVGPGLFGMRLRF